MAETKSKVDSPIKISNFSILDYWNTKNRLNKMWFEKAVENDNVNLIKIVGKNCQMIFRIF